ncbi:MAG: FHA domain-containing protein [Actinobacteria bacterium]|nr:MAG: FHA domain-containing protein [Actinomycetota bacterium]
MTALPGSIAVEEALLLLKIAFLVLLYLFIWRIVRTAARDLRLPQESFVLAPGSIPGLGGEAPHIEAGKIVVVKSPALTEGDEWDLDASPLTFGRSSQNDVELKRDEYASSSHARLEPRRDGVWLEDIGSTNGTYLNGIRLTRPKRLTAGDIVRIGETELRYEA